MCAHVAAARDRRVGSIPYLGTRRVFPFRPIGSPRTPASLYTSTCVLFLALQQQQQRTMTRAKLQNTRGESERASVIIAGTKSARYLALFSMLDITDPRARAYWLLFFHGGEDWFG